MTTPRGDALSHQRFRGSPTTTLQRFRFDRTSDSTIRLSAARLVAIPHQRGEKSFRPKMHGHHEHPPRNENGGFAPFAYYLRNSPGNE